MLDLEDAAEANPALRDALNRCTSDEEREQLAFEYFETHPQPTERREWLGSPDSPASIFTANTPTFRTSDWPGGRLPPFEDEEPSEDADGGGCLVPTTLAEEALRQRAEHGYGRQKLAQELPGLTEWTAGQVLRWRKRGKPTGLWLDDELRLHWGSAITPIWPGGTGSNREQQPAPIPVALRLPRI